MMAMWSTGIAYDLSRTLRRASVPRALGHAVPEVPGAYLIYRLGHADTLETILDIGECGLRPNSKPHGLRGRLASEVAHSASARIAHDVVRGHLRGDLHVMWCEATSKESAKEVQDALISLFVRECGCRPRYNSKREHHARPDSFLAMYRQAKVLAGCLA